MALTKKKKKKVYDIQIRMETNDPMFYVNLFKRVLKESYNPRDQYFVSYHQVYGSMTEWDNE